jgi:hypothetical protein
MAERSPRSKLFGPEQMSGNRFYLGYGSPLLRKPKRFFFFRLLPSQNIENQEFANPLKLPIREMLDTIFEKHLSNGE